MADRSSVAHDLLAAFETTEGRLRLQTKLEFVRVARSLFSPQQARAAWSALGLPDLQELLPTDEVRAPLPQAAVAAIEADRALLSADMMATAVRDWIEMCVAPAPQGWLPSGAAFDSWRGFALCRGLAPGNPKRFAEAMAINGLRVTRMWRRELRLTARGYLGLCLKNGGR